MRIIHFCFSESARGSLNMAMEQGLIDKNKIIHFIDDLSNGPIDDLNQVDKRIQVLIPSSLEPKGLILYPKTSQNHK